MLTEQQKDIIENSIWVVNTALKKQGLSNDIDLRQSAILYMCECLLRYDVTRNAKWTTYAYKSVYLYIKRVHAKEQRKMLQIADMDVFEVAENVADNSLDMNVQEIIQNNEVLRLKYEGYTKKEISQITGISIREVRRHFSIYKEKERNLDE